LSEQQNRIDALTELGLTDLEARIYILLTKQPKLSGYRVAKILGRSVPNIYNTLSAMAKKGLVLTSLKGTTNIYIPTPLEEYLEQHTRNAERLMNRTRQVFKGMNASESNPSTGIYQLENTEQVLEKARKLISNATGRITITADRFPLLHLSAFLAEASGRGVNVLVNSYSHIAIPECDVILWNRRPDRKPWPGNWLILVADGSELVVSFFSMDAKVVNAIWADNQYLSLVLHHGRSADTVLAAVLNMLKNDVPVEQLKAETLRLTEKHIFGIKHSNLFNTMQTEMENPPE